MKPTCKKTLQVQKRPRWWTFPAATCSLGFFSLKGKENIVHLVPPESETGPYSHTAICGTAATIEKPIQRFTTVDGQRINTGMGAIIFKSVEGWRPARNPDGVKRKLCERCRRSFDAANGENAATRSDGQP